MQIKTFISLNTTEDTAKEPTASQSRVRVFEKLEKNYKRPGEKYKRGLHEFEFGTNRRFGLKATAAGHSLAAQFARGTGSHPRDQALRLSLHHTRP